MFELDLNKVDNPIGFKVCGNRLYSVPGDIPIPKIHVADVGLIRRFAMEGEPGNIYDLKHPDVQIYCHNHEFIATIHQCENYVTKRIAYMELDIDWREVALRARQILLNDNKDIMVIPDKEHYSSFNVSTTASGVVIQQTNNGQFINTIVTSHNAEKFVETINLLHLMPQYREVVIIGNCVFGIDKEDERQYQRINTLTLPISQANLRKVGIKNERHS